MSRKRIVKITLSEHLMINLSVLVADTIVPAGMHILCTALRYNKPNIKKAFFFKKLELVLFLGFQYFELRNSYKNSNIQY